MTRPILLPLPGNEQLASELAAAAGAELGAW